MKDLFRFRITLITVLLVSLVWLGCTNADAPLTAPDDLLPDISVVSQDALGFAIEVQQRYTAEIMLDQNVTGTAVGLAANGQPAVKVYVAIGELSVLPERLDEIPVVVEVTGEIFALQQASKGPPCPPKCGGGGGNGDGEDPVDPTARFDRPVPIGVSTGHPAITAGTIGARVKKGSTVYALSNNHVYADENTASLGDNVLQPGTFDGGSDPADAIGMLADFELIVFSTTASNVIDAAIARSTTGDLGNATPSDGYGTPESTTFPAAVNLRVMKYGRTTGQTKARISGINATVLVGYSTGVARFVNQIVIMGGGFSAGGDSGSLIVVEKGRDKGKPVGLLFAGSSNSTIANPIDAVLAAFGVTIDGK